MTDDKDNYTQSQFVPHRTCREINRFTWYREIIAVYRENYKNTEMCCYGSKMQILITLENEERQRGSLCMSTCTRGTTRLSQDGLW
jgi:hypothetical protein